VKVFIAYPPNESGKGKFISRLVPALEKLGVQCQYENQQACDIALGLTRWRSKVKIPKILRMDGIYLEKGPKEDWNNMRVRKSIKKSNAIIWQSQFCKRMSEKIFKIKHKKDFVIFNGADPLEFGVYEYKSPFKKNVLFCAKWFSKKERKHKRLSDCIQIAQDYHNKNVGFWIAGECGIKKSKVSNLTFLGNLNKENLALFYKVSNVLVYPTLYDWCPNVIVEALVAGCPVICNAGSGPEELAKLNPKNIVLQLDSHNNFRKMKRNKPPNFDLNLIYEALDKILSIKNTRIQVPELYIDNIAKQYKQAFEEVLK